MSPSSSSALVAVFLAAVARPPTRRPGKRIAFRRTAMPATRTLHDVFIHELRDMYNAEQQLTKALPQLIDAAASDELREALAAHLGETHDQIGRRLGLEQLYRPTIHRVIARDEIEVWEPIHRRGRIVAEV